VPHEQNADYVECAESPPPWERLSHMPSSAHRKKSGKGNQRDEQA
jgi:hypothetical protein